MLLTIILYCLSFVAVWLGAGLIVSSVSDLAKTSKIPIFTVSFFLLGVLTSIPEITIGSLAVVNNTPLVFVGNLLGGVIVIFLLIIPALGIANNGVKLPEQLDPRQLLYLIIVVVTPTFLMADQRLGRWEGLLFIGLYCSLLFFLSFKMSFFTKISELLNSRKKRISNDFAKIAGGLLMLLVASHYIVDTTVYFAQVWEVSPFFVSLLLISIGTNIPELSIIFRSVKSHKPDLALSTYLGSVAFNTFLLGVFTLMQGEPIMLPNHFLQRFIFIIIGLVLFFMFARSHKKLSKQESIVLLTSYFLFIIFEILIIQSS